MDEQFEDKFLKILFKWSEDSRRLMEWNRVAPVGMSASQIKKDKAFTRAEEKSYDALVGLINPYLNPVFREATMEMAREQQRAARFWHAQYWHHGGGRSSQIRTAHHSALARRYLFALIGDGRGEDELDG